MSSKNDIMHYTMVATPALLAITLLILSAVSLGATSKIDESTHQKNAKNASTGMLVISVGLFLAVAFGYYKMYDVLKPKPSFIYYF
jgi:small-conductance mechanosensitive channel